MAARELRTPARGAAESVGEAACDRLCAPWLLPLRRLRPLIARDDRRAAPSAAAQHTRVVTAQGLPIAFVAADAPATAWRREAAAASTNRSPYEPPPRQHQACLSRVSDRVDEPIAAIVRSWPSRFETARALAPGFRSDTNFALMVREYLAQYAPAAPRR